MRHPLQALFLGIVSTCLPLTAPPAAAQPSYRLTVIPAAPSPLDEVRIRVEAACPGVYDDVVIAGATITLVHADTVPPMGAPCSTTLPYVDELFVGALPSGAYVTELFFRSQDGSLSPQIQANFEVTESKRYDVHPGTTVLGCGGFAGECRVFELAGWLEIDTEPEKETAAIPRAELELSTSFGGPFPFPGTGDLSFPELLGTIEGPDLRFVSPHGSAQSVALRLSPVAGGLVLNGVYDEGCCDRFAFEFDNVFLEHHDPAHGPGVVALRGGRFAVQIEWTDPTGAHGQATGTALSDESAWYWFFTPSNAELLVKVLDGCVPFGHYWFFAAGLTNVGVELSVEDTWTHEVRHYGNPVGEDFQPILDTAAFGGCDVTAGAR